MTLESVERLREWSHDVCGDCECDKEIQQIADEIEREIGERYMLMDTTCHYEHTGGTFGYLVCDNCGGVVVKDYRSRHRSMRPTPYCRWCGARIVRRVAKKKVE